VGVLLPRLPGRVAVPNHQTVVSSERVIPPATEINLRVGTRAVMPITHFERGYDAGLTL
jgi:hypothetical protein